MRNCNNCGCYGMKRDWAAELLRVNPCSYLCSMGETNEWEPRTWKNNVLDKYWHIKLYIKWAKSGFPRE
jgi:hypothetical protein